MRAETVGVALGLALVTATVLGANALVEPVSVAGGSMQPALYPGDVVFVDHRARPAVGDIVLIGQPGHGPVLHRVIGLDEVNRLRTKGDANPVEDFQHAELRHVRGCVSAVLPIGMFVERWRR